MVKRECSVLVPKPWTLIPATAKDPDINKGWHLGAANFSDGSKVSGLLKALYLAITLGFGVVLLIGSSRGQRGERRDAQYWSGKQSIMFKSGQWLNNPVSVCPFHFRLTNFQF
jgi:hypothetical protein